MELSSGFYCSAPRNHLVRSNSCRLQLNDPKETANLSFNNPESEFSFFFFYSMPAAAAAADSSVSSSNSKASVGKTKGLQSLTHNTDNC